MIFTERTIKIANDVCQIDNPIVLYRGDYNVEIRFTIIECPYKYSTKNSSNIIETVDASYGQLVIKVPNDGLPIFSDVVETKGGSVVFTLSGEMIDESIEVGDYTFQIRLFDTNKESRATIPPVENGISIREPIAFEDVTTTNEVGEATVGYALTTAATPEDAFDTQGNYNKTTWGTGDRITAAKLNKIEAGIDGVNNKIANLDLSGVDLTGYAKTEDIPTRVSQLTNDSNYVNTTQMNEAIANVTGQTIVEPQELDMPKVFFYGNALPTTKDNVNLTMDYISNTTKFSSFVKLKCQGTSSMSYAKKNFTVSMFSDEARATKLKKDFKGWGAQSKFCLKANYVDTTHTRNISGARIAYDMVQSRPDSTFKQQLLQCPRNGAVDGFPIKLYFNGEFYGIYTWNIPKDAWMFNMDKNNPNHVVLCAEKNTDGNSSLINSCQFRQLWTNGDGNDWSVEVGTYSQNMVDSFNRCINFVMTATDQEFHDNIGEYFDLYSLLDYYCFSYLTCHLDGLAKNMLMVTYDGVHWGASLYDMDSIYGVSWNGASFVSPQYQCPEQYQEQFSRLWVRIEQCFGAELYARYLELRQGALSLSNIVKHVEEIYDVIPDRVFADEKAKWTSLPNVNNNTMTRFRNYMRDRAVYVDAQMQEIGIKVPCTSISLDKDTLTFDLSSGGSVDETISTTYTQGYLARNQWAINSGTAFGEIKSSTKDITSDYIPCDSNSVFVTTEPAGTGSANHGIVAYDSNKQGLYALNYSNQVCTWYSKDEIVSNSNNDSIAGIVDSTITINNIPSGVAYVRCSFATSSADNVTIVRKGSTNTQILTATVEPSNTTDTVTWSVSPTNIVSVDNGLVTPIANGSCTITATCGTQTATCAVTVSGMSESGGDEVRNAWESAAWEEQYYNDSGTLTSFDVIHHSSLIPVNGDEIITVECDASVATPYLRISYFNSNREYIGYDRGSGYNIVPQTNHNTIIVDLLNTPVDIAYVSINANTSDKSLLTVFSRSIIDISTSYVNGNLNRNSNAVTSGTAGTVTENSVDITSDYIDCSNGIKISVSDTTHMIGVVAYNENKEYLATYDGQNKIWHSEGFADNMRYSDLIITTLPDTTKYIRFTVGGCTNSSLITVKALRINVIDGDTPSGGDTDIYTTAEYAITEPRTFNGTSDYIDTGIKLFDTAKTFTIFVDYTTSGTVGVGNATVFHCLHETPPYRGLCLMENNGDGDTYFIGGQAVGQSAYASDMPSSGKYLISFVNGVINNIVTLNNSNELVYSATDIASANPYVQISENLLISCYQNTSGTKGRFWKGTINKFGVWFKQLTSDEINKVFGKNGVGTESGTNSNLVFQIDSTSMNTVDNTLTDNIAGISATLTGNPTVSGNQIAFTASDKFIFDISSLDLTNSDITVRIKLTQPSLTSSTENILTIGNSNAQQCWDSSNTVYCIDNKYRFQYGISEELGANNRISDYTIGNFNPSNGTNIARAQANIEQEIVMSINRNTKDIRIFIDGELVQNGKISAINVPLYLGNHEGTNRFIGSYSLIEIYNEYCNDYTEFTNMVNN